MDKGTYDAYGDAGEGDLVGDNPVFEVDKCRNDERGKKINIKGPKDIGIRQAKKKQGWGYALHKQITNGDTRLTIQATAA